MSTGVMRLEFMSRPVRTPGAAATAALTAAVLVLTGCGAEKDGSARPVAGAGAVGADRPCPSGMPRYGATPDPAGAGGPSPASVATAGRPSAPSPASTGAGLSASTTPRPSRAPLPLPGGTRPATDGVRITGLYGRTSGQDCAAAGFSADFTVTNDTGTAMTYTITLGFLSESHGAAGTARTIVAAVPPGRTVTGTADMDEPAARVPAVTDVTVEKVRSVPVGEAPSAGGPCPPSGVHVYADQGDAAMGLRAVSLHLENCGTRAYPLNGRPAVQVVDADHEPVSGVRVVHGEEIATGTGADGTPSPLSLAPGERAYAVLTWRNTTESGDPVNAPYVRVRPGPGAAPVVVTPELDLGTTGRLGVGPWKKEDTGR
ncbi:DUF4232 domain-containing protein [Streptomyces sp. NPDC048514]|uniref:DUF4232 domain-containing protein n=1 Tax=Streptomyces sp. NPDC048514 TaxID=3365564 RepID=UPI003713BE3E